MEEISQILHSTWQTHAKASEVDLVIFSALKTCGLRTSKGGLHVHM